MYEINKIKEVLLCDKCKNLMINPVMFWECDHHFCRACLLKEVCIFCPKSLTMYEDKKMLEIINIFKQFPDLTDEDHTGREFLVDNKINVLEIEREKKRLKVQNYKTSISYKSNRKGETQLHLAAKRGDKQKCEDILKEKLKDEIIDIRDFINHKDYAGWTALHEACNHGHSVLISTLINYGAEENIYGADNETPLHDAVVNNHIDCVKALIMAGAKTNIKNKAGLLPIDYATTEEVRSLLINSATTKPSTSSIIPSEQISITDEFSFVDHDKNGKDVIKKTPNKLQNQKIHILLSGINIPFATIISELLKTDPNNNSSETQDFESPDLLAKNTNIKYGEAKIIFKFRQTFPKVKFSEKFDPTITHLVIFNSDTSFSNGFNTNKIFQTKRTMKYILSLLTGKWIVDGSWLLDCTKTQTLIDEGSYELAGCISKDQNFVCAKAPTQSRLLQQNGLPKLFSQCKFFLKGDFKAPNPSRADLINIIKLGDGKIVIRDPTRKSFVGLNNNLVNTTFVENRNSSQSIILIPNGLATEDYPSRKQPKNFNNQLSYLKGFYYYNPTKSSSSECNNTEDTHLKWFKITNENENEACKMLKESSDCKIEIIVYDVDWLLDSVSLYKLI